MYAVDERATSTGSGEEALERLVEQARARDIEAFEQVVRTLQGPIRAFTRRIMRDTGLGDDAAQETFLRIWRGLDGYVPSSRFVAWAFTVARNTSIELLRKERRAPVPTEELPEPDGPSDPTDVLDLRRAVSAAIRGLPDAYRTTFLLRQAGLSYEEIASAESCPVGTVRSRLHASRRLLAAALEPYMFGGDA